MGPTTYVGQWWESVNEGIKYYGTLSFDDLEGGKLVIIGTYKDIKSADIDLEVFPPIKNDKITEKVWIQSLYGITDLGKHVTLIGCRELEFKYTIEKQKVVYRTTFTISRIIIGIHYDNTKIRSIIVEYSLLDKWISNITIGGTFINNSAYFGTDASDNETLSIAENIEILIKKEPLVNLNQNSGIIRDVMIKSEISIEIKLSSKNELEQYLELIPKIQNFYSLLIGKPVIILATKFTTVDNSIKLQDGNIVFPESEIYQLRNQSKVFDLDFKSEPLFHHVEVRNIFQLLMQNYFKIQEEYKICYELFFSSFYDQGEYIHSKFLNYLHGLEALHGIYYPDRTELALGDYDKFKKKIKSLQLSK